MADYEEISADDFGKKNLSYFPYEQIKPGKDKDGNDKALTEGEKEINSLRKERSARDAEELWGKTDTKLKEKFPDSTVGARQALYNAVQNKNFDDILSLISHKELLGEGQKPDPAPELPTDPGASGLIDRWKNEGASGLFKETLDGMNV